MLYYYTEKGILTKSDDKLPARGKSDVQQHGRCNLLSSETEFCESQYPGASEVGQTMLFTCLTRKIVPLLRIEPSSSLPMATMVHSHKSYRDNLAKLGSVSQRTMEKEEKYIKFHRREKQKGGKVYAFKANNCLPLKATIFCSGKNQELWMHVGISVLFPSLLTSS